MENVLTINEQEDRLLREGGLKSFFSARRFYNPAVWAWLVGGRTALPKEHYNKYHSNYFFGLSGYAQGIIKKDLKESVKGLEKLYKALNPHHIFKDFIFFNGVFQDTVFLVNPDGRIQTTIKSSSLPEKIQSKGLTLCFPNESPFDFQTVKNLPLFDDDTITSQTTPSQEKGNVGAVILPKDYCTQFSDTLLRTLHVGGSGKRPKDELMELFDGRENIDTLDIGSLRFTNPFSQILCCDFAPEYNAFENALECLENDHFNSKHPPLNPLRPQKLSERKCNYCDKLFTPKTKKQKFCSSTCRTYSYRLDKTLLEIKSKKQPL